MIVSWTSRRAAATSTRLGPTEFADFTVSMGRLPDDVNELVMPTVQTYDDGTVVRWDQPEVPGAEEPEHPAPTLKLVEADHGANGNAHGGNAHGGDGHGGHGHGPAAEVGGHHHGDTRGRRHRVRRHHRRHRPVARRSRLAGRRAGAGRRDRRGGSHPPVTLVSRS
ncbi:MAG: YcnI family protein [Actinomycetota bacterium]|nr:YcnI family protein [Actinomycetota bacterium]